jgi:hypothetical protein
LGKHSLQVYSFHVILILIALPQLNNLAFVAPWMLLPHWKLALLVVLNLLGATMLIIPALFHAFVKK